MSIRQCPYGDSALHTKWLTREQLQQPIMVSCWCGARVPVSERQPAYGPDVSGAWVKLPAHEAQTGRLNSADELHFAREFRRGT